MSKKAIVQGLYFDTERKRYTHRPWVNGRRTERTLDARTEREAVKEFGRLGKVAPATSVKTLIQAYLDANTPGARRQKKNQADKYIAAERVRCSSLMDFFGNMKAEDCEVGHCIDYEKWRVKKIEKSGVSGGTTVDLDLVTLSNIFRYGTMNKLVDRNPFANGRPKFGTPQHCREHCCRSGDELHTIASALGGILALQFLFESTSGVRTGEALPLRRDASVGQPGHIRQDQGKRYLCICRLKQGDEDPYDYILINPALELVLAELDAFHAKRTTRSDWFFPGREADANTAVDPCALSHALRRVTKKLLPGRRLTSHGCRAFYVTWRRVQGIGLQTIADEVGQRSGVKLIQDVYGRNPPAWSSSDFSPFPKTVKPFWGGAGRSSTTFSTTKLRTVGIPQTTPDSEQADSSNIIVLPDSTLQHTRTY